MTLLQMVYEFKECSQRRKQQKKEIFFKKFFTSLLVREMQIKTDLKFHLNLVRMANVQKSK